MFNSAQVGQPQENHWRPASALDTALSGLLGSGQLARSPSVIEISGGISSGKSTLAFHLCLTALREGQAAGWIDSGQGFYPLVAAEVGEPLEQLLVVRVPDGEQAMRAADLLLACSGAVAIAVVSLPPRYRPPEMALLRLHRLAEQSSTLLILLDERPAHSPSVGVPIALRLGVRRSVGTGANWPLEVEVIRNKSGTCGPLHRAL
jgi:hypothetical protein